MIAAILMLMGFNMMGHPVTQFREKFASQLECETVARDYMMANPSIIAKCVSPETAKLNGWGP